MSIKPRYRITRTPTSIIANMAHLKASELRSFMLIYGLPCLWGLLPNKYFQHFLSLVDAVFLLFQDSISLDQLSKSASLLNHFCLRVESLSGRRYETFNVHCLLHLVSCDEKTQGHFGHLHVLVMKTTMAILESSFMELKLQNFRVVFLFVSSRKYQSLSPFQSSGRLNMIFTITLSMQGHSCQTTEGK